jgi:E3 ubiquitin-protein ligase synoviolin
MTRLRPDFILVGSIFSTAVVIGNAFYNKKQFYPSVVHLTKSNSSMAVLYFQALVLAISFGKLVNKLFFGQLRPVEMEVSISFRFFNFLILFLKHLVERSWFAVTETCLAFTVFRDDFSPKFIALFGLLFFIKCFHWLAEDRVEYVS